MVNRTATRARTGWGAGAALAATLFAGMAGATYPPDPPEALTVFGGDGWAMLSWEVGNGVPGVDSVTGYVVFRATFTGVWEAVATVWVDPSQQSCSSDTRAYWDHGLTSGVEYAYMVRTLTRQGLGTLYGDSGTLWVTPASAEWPGLAVSADANAGDAWVRLNWTALSTCGAGETGVTRYRIFRATSPAMLGSSPTVKEITADNGYTDDAGLTNLAEYFYIVFPAWPMREPYYLRARPYRPLKAGGAPSAFRDPSGPKSVRVNWPAAPSPDASQSFALAGYAVYRSDDGGGTMKWLDTVPAGQLTYLDLIPTYGKTYVYLVRPVDSAGNAGEAYKLASVDVILPSNRVFLDRNRFRPGRGEAVEVDFQITEAGRVRLTVMTPTGEVVKRVWDAEQAGNYNPDAPFNSHYSTLPVIKWDGTNESGRMVASGAYLVVLEIGGSRDIRAVAVIR